jgi:Papain family cysteine protease
MKHLTAHWHHYLAIAGIVLSSLILGVGGAHAYTKWKGHGFKPGPLPPTIKLGAGVQLPSSWWLNDYITRIHNQGNSNSCVGQTLATMEEITQHERDSSQATWHKRYSAGYIWNQVNGGQNVGVSYAAAFGILLSQGDARLKDFAPDGATSYWILPGQTTQKLALPFRFTSWHSITPTDRQTIKFELSHGRPLAVAMPIYSSTYNHWQTTDWITGASGSFMFWHSMTIIGYNPYGVEILNSWGPDWGDRGHSMFTWSALVNSGGELVVATPRRPLAGYPIPPFNPKLPLKGARP